MIKYKNLKIERDDLQARIITHPSQGYGYNISLFIIDYVNKLKKNLFATIHTDNILVKKLLEKLNFTYIINTLIAGIDNEIYKYNTNIN